jgi:hypothetical protein
VLSGSLLLKEPAFISIKQQDNGDDSSSLCISQTVLLWCFIRRACRCGCGQGCLYFRPFVSSVRPSVTSNKVHVRLIRVNILLTLDRVNLDLLCPRWLPHCCHIAATLDGRGCCGRIRLAEGRIRLLEGRICLHKGRIRLPEERICLSERRIRLAEGCIRPPKMCAPPPQPFTPSPLPYAPPTHARNVGVKIHLTFEYAMSTYSINKE